MTISSKKDSVGTLLSKSTAKKAATGKGAKARSNSGGTPKNQGLVAGVDIGGSNLRIALADARGKVIGKWSASTKATSSPEMVIAQIEQGVDVLLRQSPAPLRSLRSVAVGAPGVTDSKSGIVLATSYLRGWKNVPLQRLLESAFEVPAAVENDVRIGALGEHWIGAARGMDDFVFLALGTGIAAGIFANGKLIHGSNSTAGEVGYMYVPGTSEKPAKTAEPGALESMLGGDGIRQEWERLCPPERKSEKLTATRIFDLAGTGDPLAKSVLDRSAQLLAYTVYNIALVLNSPYFVLGGGVGVSLPLRDATERILSRYSEPVSPKLVISTLGTDAQIMGAIRLALNTAETRTNRGV
jgi:predicted NBD/HSP70 family sugar kinase